MEHIFNNELFLKIKIKENEDIIKNAYICKKHNEYYFNYCIKCNINICEKCLAEEHGNHEIFDLGQNFKINNLNLIKEKANSIIKKFLHFKNLKLIEIKNNKTNSNFVNENDNKKIYNLYIDLEKKSVLYIYCHIIKRLVSEQIYMNKNKIFNYYIYKNILYFKENFCKNHPKNCI